MKYNGEFKRGRMESHIDKAHRANIIKIKGKPHLEIDVGLRLLKRDVWRKS